MTSQLASIAITIARARLVQFLAIGALLFAVAPRPRDDRRIDISSRAVATLQTAEATRRGVAELPSTKAAEVTARAIEDEMLFREGLRRGLDRDDPLIRQRVIQKTLLLAEELGGANREPTRVELIAEYDRTRERYRQLPRYHVMHVFATRAADLPASLPAGALPAVGEPFPLPRETTATLAELRGSYGAAFVDVIAAQPPGAAWSAPVASPFGWHRARVIEVLPGHVRDFDEVARDVAFELVLHRREDIVQRFLVTTAARYDVRVDGHPDPDFVPPLRVARREDASAED